jgi:protease II
MTTTGIQLRDLGYVAWKDLWAVYEKQKGPEWNKLLRQEQSHWNKLVDTNNIISQTEKNKKLLDDALEISTIDSFTIGCGSIVIKSHRAYNYLWRWKWENTYKIAHDLDTKGSMVWLVNAEEDSSTSDDGSQKYKNELICQTSDGNILWRKSSVSYNIAVKNGFCIYIKVSYPFKTTDVVICNALTGKGERVIYNEKDDTKYIRIVRENGGEIYIVSENTITNTIYQVNIEEDGDCKLSQLGQKSSHMNAFDYIMPIGNIDGGEDCYIARNKHTKEMNAYGSPLRLWKLPRIDCIKWVSLIHGLVMTIEEGKTNIWKCCVHHRPRLLFDIDAGNIIPNPLGNWEENPVPSFLVKTPTVAPFVLYIHASRAYANIAPRPKQFPQLDIICKKALSTDGTRIPYSIISTIHSSRTKPKGLMVIGYGAYGSETVVGWSYTEWAPLLLDGWALAYAYIRGGGDNGMKWAEDALLENRLRSIEDFEAVIRSAQKQTHTLPKNTVCYGRSAGGFLMGNIINRNPDCSLFGAVYTEVPYVNALRTSTDPALQLTLWEYDNFGNPAKRPLNFRTMMMTSPMEGVPPNGVSPNMLVIARTGLLDEQVYPNEPFKWVNRLRGFEFPAEIDSSVDNNKFLAFEHDEAHIFSEKKRNLSRATDLAILQMWLNKNRNTEYKMVHRKTHKKTHRKAHKKAVTHRRKTVHRRKTAKKVHRRRKD